MKVWIVFSCTEGYDDYDVVIHAVFTSKEKAHKYVSDRYNSPHYLQYTEAKINE